MLYGEVSELADEHDLGSCAERRGGSNPPFPTTNLALLPISPYLMKSSNLPHIEEMYSHESKQLS